MNKTQFINQLNAKDDVNSPFLVKYLQSAEGKDGKSYLNVILADKSGEIEARKWHGSEVVLGQFKSGDLALVKGKINLYQGRLQLIITEMGKVDQEQVNFEDYIKKAGSGPEKMYEELLNVVSGLEEYYIRELLISILNEPEIARRLKIWQAGKSIHHAYQSGLLEHILSCTKLANMLSAHYNANRSYVVAGCILHDLCKIYELTEGPVVDYTDEGKLVGHLVQSLEVVDIFASKIPNFPYNVKLHLKHILLSHHGEYEYGSPKVPSTSEAYLVHLIDFMDSKMSSLEQVKQSDSNIGNWSGFVKHLDRIVYKNELPSFTSPMGLPTKENNKPEKKIETAPVNKTSNPTMGNLLKNFKIEE